MRALSRRHLGRDIRGTATGQACHPRARTRRGTRHRPRRSCHARSAAGQYTPSARRSLARPRLPTPLRPRRPRVPLPPTTTTTTTAAATTTTTIRHSCRPPTWVASPRRNRRAFWPVTNSTTGDRRIWEGSEGGMTIALFRAWATGGSGRGVACRSSLGRLARCLCWAWFCSLWRSGSSSALSSAWKMR